MQEDPEITDFKNAAADTAHDVKKSVKPDDSTASKDSNQKSVLESVSPHVQSAFGCSFWYSCLVAYNKLYSLMDLKKAAKLEHVVQQTH